jgi:hypothetical protein
MAMANGNAARDMVLAASTDGDSRGKGTEALESRSQEAEGKAVQGKAR